jgi:anti-sigma28 factor (negative regulator of flagellin synthesis)
MASKFPCCGSDSTKTVEDSHERKLIRGESKTGGSEEALQQMNEMKTELLGKIDELKELIEQTRCQCKASQPLDIDQVNELKEMIRDGGCHCAQAPTSTSS